MTRTVAEELELQARRRRRAAESRKRLVERGLVLCKTCGRAMCVHHGLPVGQGA